jgi:glycosyltransferase involved in cell wall biosynthesis
MIPWSLEAARYKFEGTIPYCAGPHYFFTNVNDFEKMFIEAPLHSMLGVWHGRIPQEVELEGSRLIESIAYEDNSFHLFVLKEPGARTLLSYPHKQETKYIPGVTFGFICTADEPYISIFGETVQHYKRWLPENMEISVVLFGEADLPPGIRVRKEPLENFNMAYARNLCLQNASYDHMFVLDADVRLSYSEFDRIIGKFQQFPNGGVLNLKNHPHLGNGLYFGNRHVMAKNGYDERFKKFWAEDTEHLMNYSRTGVIPLVVFEDFQRVNHSRSKTLNSNLRTLNFNLISNILNAGSREACPQHIQAATPIL